MVISHTVVSLNSLLATALAPVLYCRDSRLSNLRSVSKQSPTPEGAGKNYSSIHRATIIDHPHAQEVVQYSFR